MGGHLGRFFCRGLRFLKKVDVLEGELLRMKVEVEGLFGEVGVRV